MTDLSVIIVSWNTREMLEMCIASVVMHLRSIVNVEIIVVDNASSDGSAEMIESGYPFVHLIKNNKNIGFANAVNQGAIFSSGRMLLLLNSDARLMDARLMLAMGVLESDSSVGIATGQMVDGEGKEIPAYYRFPGFLYLVKSYTLDRVYTLGHQMRGRVRKCARNQDGTRICDVDWVSGGYLLVKRELLADYGLLDPRIFMYYEDALLCKRAWDTGYRVVFVDDASVLHERGASAKQVRVKAIRYSYESSRLYIQSMYGDDTLKWYETVNRGMWRVLSKGLWLFEKLGLGRLATPKRKLFENLLSTPRLT